MIYFTFLSIFWTTISLASYLAVIGLLTCTKGIFIYPTSVLPPTLGGGTGMAIVVSWLFATVMLGFIANWWRSGSEYKATHQGNNYFECVSLLWKWYFQRLTYAQRQQSWSGQIRIAWLSFELILRTLTRNFWCIPSPGRDRQLWQMQPSVQQKAAYVNSYLAHGTMENPAYVLDIKEHGNEIDLIVHVPSLTPFEDVRIKLSSEELLRHIGHSHQNCEINLENHGGNIICKIRPGDRLPRLVHLRDYLAEMPVHCLPLGVNADGKMVLRELSYSGANHMLVTGRTGSGKTAFLLSLATAVLQKNPSLEVLALDPKREFELLSPHARVQVKSDLSEIKVAIDWLTTENDRRNKLISEAGVQNYGQLVEAGKALFPPLLIFIDEFAVLLRRLKELDKQVAQKLTNIVLLARSAGMTFIVSLQKGLSEALGSELRSQLTPISFRVERADDARLVFGDTASGAEKLSSAGAGVWRNPETGRYEQFRAFFCEPDELRKFAASEQVEVDYRIAKLLKNHSADRPITYRDFQETGLSERETRQTVKKLLVTKKLRKSADNQLFVVPETAIDPESSESEKWLKFINELDV